MSYVQRKGLQHRSLQHESLQRRGSGAVHYMRRTALSLPQPITTGRSPMGQTRIMSPERVRRILRRFAYEIIERNRGAESVELFGIRESGGPLARAIAKEMEAVAQISVPVYDLDVTPFRDDRPDRSPPDAPTHQLDVTDRDVILIDDVVCTGRTARAALDAVVQYGRPRSIQLVVLVDRDHRVYPIQPDCTGQRLQTKTDERVVVQGEESFSVYVRRGGATSTAAQSNAAAES